MKTLHRYIVREIMVTLLMTVGVFTFVVLLFNVLKEVLPLLISSGGHLGLLAKAVGLLIPFAAVYALPMGFITAALLVFGRLSADQELTAARASGLSLFSLITPVLLLSLLCCGLSAWFNMDLGPRSRVAYLQLRQTAREELLNDTLGSMQLPADTFIRSFAGFIFYTEKNDNGNLQNVIIYQVEDETNVVWTITAPQGKIVSDLPNKIYFIHLVNARQVRSHGPGQEPFVSSSGTLNSPNLYPTNGPMNLQHTPKISDMTFAQLRAELGRIESLRLPVTTTNRADLRAQLAAFHGQMKDPTEIIRVEMNRQVAFSFACFGFTLIGIPLGIRVHRRETNIGIAMALVLVAVYFSFVMLAQSLAGRAEFAPHLIVWLPNFLFEAVGAVLLWRANRGAV